MRTKILDGRPLARRILAGLKVRVAAFVRKRGRPPALVILSAGSDPPSRLYIRKKLEACARIGIAPKECTMMGNPSQAQALKALSRMAEDGETDGIIIETPLPRPLDLRGLLQHLPPGKDAEGLSPANYGRLFSAKSLKELSASGAAIPPTAGAILALVRKSGIRAAGAQAVVVGRSSIAGRPTAHLLSCLDATVTLCHSRTRRLEEHLRRADIVVSAVGRPRFIQGRMLKPGAVVIDAGIGYLDGKLCGDVDFASARKVAGAVTLVPGGVGPLTTAMLLSNVLLCAERR